MRQVTCGGALPCATDRGGALALAERGAPDLGELFPDVLQDLPGPLRRRPDAQRPQ
jgi:hypothetical protein